MTGRIARRIAAALAAAGCATAVALAPGLPALAHGAPTQPISRTAACAEGGQDTGTAACRAALKANGGPFGTFDNLRIAGVNGRDRQVVPDGELCSGGLADFRGLDLPRDDYPTTTLTAGGPLTMQYRTTIPHEGSFRVYLTKQGFRPTRPLTWSDLDTRPLFTADNPPIQAGAYRMSGKLPADRTGRHIVYTIWQTTSTPDTYYSCSDVVITGGSSGGGAVVPTKAPAKAPAAAKPRVSSSSRPTASAASPAPILGGELAARESTNIESGGTGWKIFTAALIVLAAVTGLFVFLRIRRARRAQ